jgi:hypothetical protein
VYGRDEILSQANVWVRRAFAGEGRLILLAGEPGIGKSTLAGRIAADATRTNSAAVVAWGRCWEAGGAPAYWPWIQVFRDLGMDDDPFAGAVPDLSPGASEARFAAFDRAVRSLKLKAAEAPLALVLDDLHVADAPSLLVLLLLSRQLRGSPILAVGAYRDAEVRLHPGAAQLLSKVAREAEHVRLQRLRPEDVAAWTREVVSGATAEQVEDLYQWTEGHPLFVSEALKLAEPDGLGRFGGPLRLGSAASHGAAGRRERPRGDVRGGLGGVLDEHLGRLSASTRAVLEVAAVLGREFSSLELAETSAEPLTVDAIHRALTEAMATSIVVPTRDADRMRFSHVLMRDRIYAELLPSKRAELHLCAGTALASRGAASLVAAAHHLLESHGAASAEQVAQVALAAVESSLSRLAFEEAAWLARRALGEAVPDTLRVRLEIVLAESLIRLGEAEQGRALCVRAGAQAESVGANDLLARAALVYGTELLSGAIDPMMVDLLRRALAALGMEDSPVRARVMARLAAALTPPVALESMSEILGLMRGATSMAERLGDRHALLYVLQFAATVALLAPEEERFSAMERSVELARGLEQPLILMQVMPGYITALVARGDRAGAEAALPAYEELVAESRQPIARVHVALLRALLAAVRGDLEEAERQSAEARALADRAGSEPGMRLWLAQRLSFAMLRSTPELVTDEAARVSASFDWSASGVPYVAWILVTIGRRDEAAARLRSVNVQALGVPSANLMELVGAAQACIPLGDVELANRIYPTLVRAADRMFWSLSPGAIIGPTARTLGDLARFIGRPRDAIAHYDAAIAFCERLGAPDLVRLCQDLRAAGLREAALDDAASMPGVPALRTAPSPIRRGALGLQREQDVWAISSPSGSAFRLKHSKGLAYLRCLMDQPGRHVHVLELAGIDLEPGDAGAVLDARAKAAYRERLDALREQLTEAESFADAARASRIEAEIQSIAEQLAGAVGLGGRDRLAASTVERARINVQRCLKDALARITAADPALGRYLSAAVKSGTYCSYQPF